MLVVCVDDDAGVLRTRVRSPLARGMVYTVVGECPKTHPGGPYWLLAELGKIHPLHCGCYAARLFRPVRRQPDISAIRAAARAVDRQRKEDKPCK